MPWIRCPEEWKAAVEFINFSVELCLIQIRAGRGFAFEHPRLATSWKLPSLMQLAAQATVREVRLDMCQFGMKSRDEEGEGLVRKSTSLLTNVPQIAEAMSRTCSGGHRHVALMSGRAAKAAIYPDDFCRTMMRAVDTWIKSLDSPTNALNGFLRDDLCDPDDYNYDNDYGGHKEAGYYWDDVKDGRLDSKLAKAARAEELEVFRKRSL